MSKRTVFIFGSGQSMLSLTDEERAYLAEHPRTVAMNKYLLFWRTIGVWPRFWFMADHEYPCQYIYFESMRVIEEIAPHTVSYLHRYYRRFAPSSCLDALAGAWEKREVRRAHGYQPPALKGGTPVVYFRSGSDSPREVPWAHDLSDPLYFRRGSLTTLLNLCAVCFPDCDISLLGIDLLGVDSFYAKEAAQVPELNASLPKTVQRRLEREKQFGAPAIAVPAYGKPGIQSYIPEVLHFLGSQGTHLTCGTQGSRLVNEGICEYKAILSHRI